MKKIFALCLALLISAVAFADKTICLNMIVKDESPVIERCLKSLKPFIDYWVIVDTGSTDGTQKIIRKYLKGVPGELHERPWVNFGHNRDEALKLAKGKGDYLFFIDADEVIDGTFDKKILDSGADVYLGTIVTNRAPLLTYQRALLINNHRQWQWRGVLHESLKYEDERSFELVKDVVVGGDTRDGHRAQDPKKYLKDAQTLEKALLDEPDSADYVFYLAQSYYNAGERELALQNFARRAAMQGWDQHTFWAKYCVGHLQEVLKKDYASIVKSYCEAFRYRPTRAEPLFRLANYFYENKDYILGYLLTKLGLTMPRPNDIVYVEDWIYNYGLVAVFGNCALEMGKDMEAIGAYEKLVKVTDVPEISRQEALSTIQFLKSKHATAEIENHKDTKRRE